MAESVNCKIYFIKAMSGDSFLLEFSDKTCILNPVKAETLALTGF